MTRLPTEKIRGSMSKMCALAEDIGDFRRFSISFTGKRSNCPPRLVSMQNFLANRFCPLKTKKRLRTQENAQTESLFVQNLLDEHGADRVDVACAHGEHEVVRAGVCADVVRDFVERVKGYRARDFLGDVRGVDADGVLLACGVNRRKNM